MARGVHNKAHLNKTAKFINLAVRPMLGYLFAAALAFFFIIRLNDAPCLFRCFAILIFQSFYVCYEYTTVAGVAGHCILE